MPHPSSSHIPSRAFGRKYNAMRPIQFELGVARHAEGSCNVHFGMTNVLVTATLEEHVPPFLRKSNRGWLTAEYSLMPRATPQRNNRNAQLTSGRNQEISRLIGRSLRSIVDFKALGERQIRIDCDVIDADAGTRTAAITGGFLALYQLCQHMLQQGQINRSPLIDSINGVSIVLKDDHLLLDPDYDEDSTADTDANFVLTGSGKLIEVQSGSESHKGFTASQLTKMLKLAQQASKKLWKQQQSCLQKHHLNIKLKHIIT